MGKSADVLFLGKIGHWPAWHPSGHCPRRTGARLEQKDFFGSSSNERIGRCRIFDFDFDRDFHENIDMLVEMHNFTITDLHLGCPSSGPFLTLILIAAFMKNSQANENS